MIEVGEKFNLGKFFSGLVNPVTGAKSIVIGLWICMFIVVGYTFYRAYRKAPPTTTQTGNITNYNYDVKQTFGCMRMPQVKK